MDIVRLEVIFPLLAAVLGFMFLLATGGRGREDGWKEAARRLGGRLYSRGGDHRIIFPWRGADATLLEKPRLSFEVALRGFPAPRFQMGGRPRELEERDAAAVRFLAGPAQPIFRELQAWSPEIIEMGEAFRVVVVKNDDVLGFARVCLRIAEHARLQASESSGVTVLGEGTVHQTECQVCGGSLVEGLVRCARCRTPHHEECWAYARFCSTYGCGSRERC